MKGFVWRTTKSPKQVQLGAGAAPFTLADQHTLHHQFRELLAGFQAVHAENFTIIGVLDKPLVR